MKKVFNDPSLKEYRRILRHNQTPLEEIFWNEVRNRKFFGIKIKRQVSIAYWIVDFYIPEKKIIIEIDGDSHAENQKTIQRDRELTDFCLQNTIKIVRFTNSDIYSNLEGCLMSLAEICEVPLT